MNPFQRRPLGRTSLSLSALGFGGSSLGNLYRPVAEEEASAAIDAAFAAGIRYFDVAPLYGNGLGEHRMGRDLRRYPRDDYVLSTKVGRLLEPLDPKSAALEPDPSGLPFRVVHDYGYDGVMRSMEDSLQRLGMNRVDIALIHDIDTHNHGEAAQKRYFREAMNGAYPALKRMRDEGTVRAIGVGVNDWRVCQACLEAGEFDCFLLAGRYTLLDQGALATFLPACLERGVGVIIGAPFNSGILAPGAADGATYDDAKPSPAILEKARRVNQICAGHGVSRAAAALRFPLGHGAVAAVLTGVRSAAQAEENIRLFDEAIPDDLWRELKDEKLIDGAAPIPEP
jgi:D-threo-aldose 1-dehydrogenase